MIDGKEDVAKTTFNNDPTIFETQQMAGIYNSLKQYQKAIDIYTKLVAADPKNIDLNVGLARVQFAAGMLDAAKSTLRSMEKDHPELTDQIEAAIKTIK